MLTKIENISGEQANELVAAYNNNPQLQGSFGFSGEKPRLYGNGLLFFLNRLTNHNYKLSDLGTIEMDAPIF